MSARWKRTIKNRKWLDLNELTTLETKNIPNFSETFKVIPTHTSFRPSKSYAKAVREHKPLIDIFQENNTITIVAEIVGFNKETFKINVKDQKITLSAKSKERRYYKSLNLTEGSHSRRNAHQI